MTRLPHQADPRHDAGLPRLTGPRVALVPVSLELAQAVCDGSRERVQRILRTQDLGPADDWPHDDTAPGLLRLTLDPALTGPLTVRDLGTWLITYDGIVIGDCGWQGGPDERGQVVLGYGLCLSARGRGLATEAVALLSAWAERQPGVVLLVADVRVGNDASIRLLRRLGFVSSSLSPGDDPHRRLIRPVAPPTRPRGRHVC